MENKKAKPKSKEYNKGFLDGYEKAFKDFKRIKKEVDKTFKPLKKLLNKMRERY